MAEQKIELRKIRDFGENISDAIQFIKQEFKPLLRAFLAFSGLFIIAYGIMNGMYQRESMGNLLSGFGNRYSSRDPFSEIFTPTYFLILALGNLTFTSMVTTFACYFKVYDLKGGVSPELEEVWNEYKKYILPMFFYNIIVIVVLIISALFCIVPIFYVGTALAPFAFIVIVENGSFGYAFSRCFSILKDNFWMSLGIYIIVLLIAMISALIIGSVIGIIAGLISYLTTKDIAGTTGLVTGILGIFTHIFYMIYFVSVGLNYFSMVEKIDGEGLMRKIDSIGNNNNSSQIEEQY